MQMTPQEVRQLRAWAVETALGKAAANRNGMAGGHELIDIREVITDARKLTAFVRSNP